MPRVVQTQGHRKALEEWVEKFENVVVSSSYQTLTGVKKKTLKKEILEASKTLAEELDKIKDKKPALQQIFCLDEQEDLFMKIQEISKEAHKLVSHEQESFSKTPLDSLDDVLEDIHGILDGGPKGKKYHFPPMGTLVSKVSFTVSDTDRKRDSDKDAELITPKAEARLWLHLETDVSSDVRKRVAWMWGDKWRGARRNPLRWSKWYDVAGAKEALTSLLRSSSSRSIILYATDKPGIAYNTISDAVGAIQRCEAGDINELEFNWMWGDQRCCKQSQRIHWARWSGWNGKEYTCAQMDGMRGVSRPVIVVSRSMKHYRNVQLAIDKL